MSKEKEYKGDNARQVVEAARAAFGTTRDYKEFFRSAVNLLASDSTSKFPSQAELLGRIRAVLLRGNEEDLWTRFKNCLPPNLAALNVPVYNDLVYVYAADSMNAHPWRIKLAFFSDNFETPANETVPHYEREESAAEWTLLNARRVPESMNGYSNYLSVAKELLGGDRFAGFVDLLRRFQDPKEEFLFDDMYKEIAERLSDNPELIYGFGQFVTDEQAIRLNQLADELTVQNKKKKKPKKGRGPKKPVEEEPGEKLPARRPRKPKVVLEEAKDEEPEEPLDAELEPQAEEKPEKRTRKKKRVEPEGEEAAEASPREPKRQKKAEPSESESPKEEKVKPSQSSKPLTNSNGGTKTNVTKKRIAFENNSSDDEDFKANSAPPVPPPSAGDADAANKRNRPPPRVAADLAVQKMRLFDNDFDLTALKPEQCQRVSPSYIVLPPYALNFHSSGMDDLGREVLNDSLHISPPKAKNRQEEQYMNPHAEVLSMLEQDQFEMDLLIERARSTLERIETICGMASSASWSDDDFELELVLGPVHRHTLKQVYGRLGIEKIDLLLAAPASVVPEVITAMKNKLAEYYESKGKFLVSWRNVPREHCPLSLNDRGAFFKKKDKANRQPIAFVAELKKAQFNHNGSSDGQLRPLPGSNFEFGTVSPLGSNDSIRFVFELTAEVIRHIVEGSQLKVALDLLHKIAVLFFSLSPETAEEIFKSKLPSVELNIAFEELSATFPFVANMNFLTSFKLIQIATERIDCTSKFVNFDSSKFDWSKFERPVPIDTTISANAATDTLLKTKPEPRPSDELVADSSKKIPEFRALLTSLFTSATSTAQYEERVIRLFGLEAFQLFGLDQLFVQLARLLIDISKSESDLALFSDHTQSLTSHKTFEAYLESATASITEKAEQPGDLLALPIVLLCHRRRLFARLISPAL